MNEVNMAPIDRKLLVVKDYLPGMIDECTDLFLKVFTEEPWNDKWDTREDAKKYLESHVQFNSFVGFVAVFKNRIVGASFGFIKPWQEGFEYYIVGTKKIGRCYSTS